MTLDFQEECFRDRFREVVTRQLGSSAALIGTIVDEIEEGDPVFCRDLLTTAMARIDEVLSEGISSDTRQEAGFPRTPEWFDGPGTNGSQGGKGSERAALLQEVATIH